jgi:hypothetical protein
MGAALRAHRFHTHHAVGAIDAVENGALMRCLGKTGPTATGIEFGFGAEQFGFTTDAPVLAFLPLAFVFACEWTFGGRVSGDFKGHRFCAFGNKVGTPFGIGLR